MCSTSRSDSKVVNKKKAGVCRTGRSDSKVVNKNKGRVVLHIDDGYLFVLWFILEKVVYLQNK